MSNGPEMLNMIVMCPYCSLGWEVPGALYKSLAFVGKHMESCQKNTPLIEARERIAELEAAIRALLTVLPNSISTKPCWAWCWNELDYDEQERVLDARKRAEAALRGEEAPDAQG